MVFALFPDINVKVMPGDGNELHPTGYHTMETCPYMKAKFQLHLADLVSKMIGLRPKPKAYAPYGGYSAHLVASAPIASAVVDNKIDRFTHSTSLF